MTASEFLVTTILRARDGLPVRVGRVHTAVGRRAADGLADRLRRDRDILRVEVRQNTAR